MALREPIAAPPAVPPRVGLIASAITPPTEQGERWQLGITYQPENCSGGGVGDPCGGGSKTIGPNADIVDYDPFYVWAGDQCSAFGFDAHDYIGRANRLLLASESFQIAREFWTGAQATASGWPNRFLASAASDVLSPGTGLTPIQALSCLEMGLADCNDGQRGMIHATRQVALLWAQNGLIKREGNLVLTINDTIVVADAGYDGSDPDGNPATNGAVWAYATDMVTVRRGPIAVVPDKFSEAVDRSVNLIEYRAERLAAATFDGCCHLAVQIAADVCGIGGS